MLPATMSITQARRLLPSLLRELELHPGRVFRISVRRRLAAELKAPPRAPKRGSAASALLRLSKRYGASSRTKGRWRVSEDTDSFVY